MLLAIDVSISTRLLGFRTMVISSLFDVKKFITFSYEEQKKPKSKDTK